jgi:hypothetical protein
VARFYANENFPLPAVEELRRLGNDVLTIQETGRGGKALPDHEVLDLARVENRILLTVNRRHFIRLHGAHPDHGGIVVCTYDPDFSGQALRIHEAVAGVSELAGRLIRVNRPAK